jgi:multidrug efflux system membrane fusion protein
VKAGNLVTANATELMTIAQIQPVFVTFAVPAVHLADIKNRLAANQIRVVATPQDLQAQPSTGRLTFFDNVVDPSTDTIKLKATFDNPDLRLWPGQFARITLRLTILDHATVVPTEAVQTGQDGQFVFVVKTDSTVEQRPVTTGERAGQDTVIQKGLQAGETVVTEGQLRLEDGTRVQNAAGRAGAGGPGRGRGGRSGSGPGGRGQ